MTKQGVTTTKWEVNELKLGVRRINAARKKELARALPSPERGTLASVQRMNLSPKKFNLDKIRKSDWAKFVESVEKQSSSNYYDAKMETYKKNYLGLLKTTFGNQAAELYSKLEKLSARELYDAYFADPILQIEFYYDPLEQEEKLNALLLAWNDYL